MDIVAIGELLIDFTSLENRPDGYPTLAAHPGGAPANFLASAANLGATTAMFAKVGDDSFGRLLTKTLQHYKINTENVLLDRTAFTTLAFVTLDDQGEREFSFSRKPGADTMLRFEELNLRIVDKTQVLHFGSLSLTDEPARSCTRQVVDYAKRKGKLITFDPNLRRPLWTDLDRAKEEILWGIGQADVLKISDDEAAFLFKNLSYPQIARQLQAEFGIQLVFITLGKDGCFFSNRQGYGQIPGCRGLTVVDTTGAGDIFGGSAVCQILQTGEKPENLSLDTLAQIATVSCAAAGLSVTRPGGISSIPSKEEISAYLEAHSQHFHPLF